MKGQPPPAARRAQHTRAIVCVPCSVCGEIPDVNRDKNPGNVRVAISHECKEAKAYVARLFYFDPGRPESDEEIAIRAVTSWNQYVRSGNLLRSYREQLEQRKRERRPLSFYPDKPGA